MTIGDNTALVLEGGIISHHALVNSLVEIESCDLSDLLIPIVFLIGDSNAVREILRRRHIS